jgi:phosphoglycerate dehydrogenase-like enzyme
MTATGTGRNSGSVALLTAWAFAAGLDYLVCVLPNTESTRRMVDAEVLQALPKHALLVNIGRGRTVDEKALAEALSSGQLAGAILDVFENEPLPPDHFLWDIPNVIITSHTSGPSFPEDLAKVFVRNYWRYISGQTLLHLVDFERGY